MRTNIDIDDELMREAVSGGDRSRTTAICSIHKKHTPDGRVMRTNIEIDDGLMRSAMAATGLRTKKAVVEEALKLLVRLRGQERLKELGGKIAMGRRPRRDAAQSFPETGR